jgi:hypothetical protein
LKNNKTKVGQEPAATTTTSAPVTPNKAGSDKKKKKRKQSEGEASAAAVKIPKLQKFDNSDTEKPGSKKSQDSKESGEDSDDSRASGASKIDRSGNEGPKDPAAPAEDEFEIAFDPALFGLPESATTDNVRASIENGKLALSNQKEQADRIALLEQRLLERATTMSSTAPVTIMSDLNQFHITTERITAEGSARRLRLSRPRGLA